jgi:hypothetical protein
MSFFEPGLSSGIDSRAAIRAQDRFLRCRMAVLINTPLERIGVNLIRRPFSA